MAGSTDIFTKTLTDGGTLTIDAIDNVLKLSVSVSEGSIEFSGNTQFKGEQAEVIMLSAGQGVTIESGSPSIPLNGITVYAPTASDSCDIILSFQ